jgi:hypothetical protein
MRMRIRNYNTASNNRSPTGNRWHRVPYRKMYRTVKFENDSCRNVRTYHLKSDPTWSEPGLIHGDQREVSAGQKAAQMSGLCGRHNCGHHHTRSLQGGVHTKFPPKFADLLQNSPRTKRKFDKKNKRFIIQQYCSLKSPTSVPDPAF